MKVLSVTMSMSLSPSTEDSVDKRQDTFQRNKGSHCGCFLFCGQEPHFIHLATMRIRLELCIQDVFFSINNFISKKVKRRRK